MNIAKFFALLFLAANFSALASGRAFAASTEMSARCEALRSHDFSGIPDALTQVIEAKLVEVQNAEPNYCEVRGYIAQNVGFLQRLPTANWNGKFIEIGCGGACGSTEHIQNCDDPLRRGYACIVSDGGHRSTYGDVKWAYNDSQAVLEYFIWSSHVTALAGKAIAETFYAQAPRRSYFSGCSAGGMQAMWAAQRFPWDFDGIIAGAPNFHLSESWMNLIWGTRALQDEKGELLLDQASLDVLHRAVVEKCDLNDGVKDGLIGDPRMCKFETAAIRCRDGDGEGCLTARQVDAADKIYGGPVTSQREQIVLPVAMRGSELTWLNYFGGGASNPSMHNYIGEWFRYYFFQPNPGPAWQIQAFDFDRDYRRLGRAEVSDPSSPDLRRFKAAGGKLLSYAGWNDAIVGTLRTIDYYENVEKLLGGRAATQDFYRLFVVPGMNHCSGGDGASTVNYLSYLEAWVEKDQAPDQVIGHHLKTGSATARLPSPNPADIEFSRPIYPYPTAAEYVGRGDPNSHSSFKPVDHSSRKNSPITGRN